QLVATRTRAPPSPAAQRVDRQPPLLALLGLPPGVVEDVALDAVRPRRGRRRAVVAAQAQVDPRQEHVAGPPAAPRVVALAAGQRPVAVVPERRVPPPAAADLRGGQGRQAV